MSWTEFLMLLGACGLTIFIFRVAPMLVLKGKEIPENLSIALGLIPPAAFAALVSNDILTPGMFDAGIWPAGAMILAALVVIVISLKTKSLIWSAIVGVVSFSILLAI